jgi:hypothetical protein
LKFQRRYWPAPNDTSPVDDGGVALVSVVVADMALTPMNSPIKQTFQFWGRDFRFA